MIKSLPKSFVDRANRMLSMDEFDTISNPIFISNECATLKPDVDTQYILRMLIKSPETNNEFAIPDELNWIKPTILRLDNLQKFNNLQNPWVYITIRHGVVTTKTDDSWHVDGFSMRFPHVPEQNYIFANHTGTEYADQIVKFPDDFDPLKHNIHDYFSDHGNITNIKKCEDGAIYLIDPYCIHRRPTETKNSIRTFWRLSFLPIEINDNGATDNPLLPKKNIHTN